MLLASNEHQLYAQPCSGHQICSSKGNRPRPHPQIRPGGTVPWTDANPCPISTSRAGVLPGDSLSESAGETLGAGGEVTRWDRVCLAPCQMLFSVPVCSPGGGERCGLWGLNACVCIWALPFLDVVTLGQLLNLSEPVSSSIRTWLVEACVKLTHAGHRVST